MIVYRGLMFCSASILAITTPAFAQTDAQSPSDVDAESRNDEIIVNARRREESVQDVPAVVDVISAESISKLNIQDSKELQNLVPGLQLRSESNRRAQVANQIGRFQHRGAGFSGYFPRRYRPDRRQLWRLLGV